MEATTKTAVLILAAGNSSRMGSPKFLLKFDKKKCFLEKIVEEYRAFGCDEIKVVFNTENEKLFHKNAPHVVDNHDIIVNEHPEWERFYSIKIGLEALDKPDFVFIHPIDNPYVSFDVLAAMTKKKNQGDYVVPVYSGKGGHPILINRNIIQQVVHYHDNFPNLKEFLSNFNRFNVEANTDKILENINTKDDYTKYKMRSDL